MTPAFLACAKPAAAGGVLTNVALVSNGATAAASSTYGGSPTHYNLDNAHNGETDNHPPGTQSDAWVGWNDDTAGAWPDWYEVIFDAEYPIQRVDLYSLHDDYTASHTSYGAGPNALSDEFTKYGLLEFNVQYWNGSTFVTVSGGTVVANSYLWTQFNFSPVMTTKIRIHIIAAALDGGEYSRIVELECYAII